MKKANLFRKKYPRFIYKNYSYKIAKDNLEIFFNFTIEPGIEFRPKVIVKDINKKRFENIDKSIINNLIFHLGLAEIPSYWKAACSPEIIIEAGYLNAEQIKWWKNLIIMGMGQFFYENKIDFRKPNFLQIRSLGTMDFPKFSGKTCGELVEPLTGRFLVPMGGGRDSIVTLEKLKEQNKIINCFLVTPSKAAQNVVKAAGIKNPVIVERALDPILFALNKKSYLNGHTPFTALLSFYSVFCAVLFDYQNIAFSNEKSADEGNLKYLGRVINHQYSKSSYFEKRFKSYSKKYLAKNINCFSFLRRYTELEISKMFTKYPKYFSVFSSCNRVGDGWCGKCPKCLFVYLTLYPFLEKKELLKIFGEDFFEKKELLSLMRALMGERGLQKPFECVGTKKESRLALTLSRKKALGRREIPFLLTKLK